MTAQKCYSRCQNNGDVLITQDGAIAKKYLSLSYLAAQIQKFNLSYCRKGCLTLNGLSHWTDSCVVTVCLSAPNLEPPEEFCTLQGGTLHLYFCIQTDPSHFFLRLSDPMVEDSIQVARSSINVLIFLLVLIQTEISLTEEGGGKHVSVSTF